ncbi:MAG: hypothetical protein U9O94_08425 [Nanoarchaeota archaeon]|nr:hypothetical protein [Nanoarchaeota archaeon]
MVHKKDKIKILAMFLGAYFLLENVAQKVVDSVISTNIQLTIGIILLIFAFMENK